MRRNWGLVVCALSIAGCGPRDQSSALPSQEAARVSNGASGTLPGEPAPPPGKFRIRLSRTSRIGERIRIDRTVTDLDNKRVTRDGKVTKDLSTRARLLSAGCALPYQKLHGRAWWQRRRRDPTRHDPARQT
jgi:hypothetical protein